MKIKVFILVATLIMLVMGPPGHAVAWQFGRSVLLAVFGVDTFASHSED